MDEAVVRKVATKVGEAIDGLEREIDHLADIHESLVELKNVLEGK